MKNSLSAILFFIAGATLLSTFSMLQKGIIGVPVHGEGLIIPFLFGGFCGLLISLREKRLKKEIRFRRWAEEKLYESEERQRTIVDSLGMGIMVIDPDGNKIVQINPEGARITGYNQDEIIGKTCHESICPVGEENCTLIDKGNEIHHTQRIFLTASGAEKPVLKSVIPIQLNGRKHYLEGFIDNTKRWQAEKKLRETIERFKALTNHLNVGYYRNTPGEKGRFIEANASVLNMFGFSNEDELIRTTVAELYQYPEERAKISAKLLKEGVIKNEKIRLIRRNGTLLIGSVSAAAVKNERGVIEYFDGIIEDVTERELIAEKLRKSEKQYKDLFNSITDLVYTQDLEGRFTSVNSAMEKVFGFDLEEFIGRKASNFMKPEFVPHFEREYLRGIRKNKYYEGVTSYYTKRGDKIYLEYRSALVQPEKGEPFISGIARNVTGRIEANRKIKTLQQQMLQVQKMEAIGTLAGGIAHDFNNILSAVIGYTELALFDVEEGTHLYGSLMEVLKAGKRATDLVKQILTFSRQSEHMIKPIYLNPLVKEALKMLRPTIPSSIELKEKIDHDLLTIKADQTQIHQVIVNMITNASHAVDQDDGVIEISLEPFGLAPGAKETRSGWVPGNYARVTITDSGSGISEEHIDHIFDPYFSTKKKQKGTGLGLSVVHGIVKTYNGQITVTSKINQGTTFSIYFPVATQAAIVEGEADRSRPLPMGREHILFVDDESAIVDLQKQILKQLGYTVTERTSSLEAVEAFRSNPEKYDLIITDMTMPNISGDKLAQEVKKIRPDIPVILCTGFSEKLNRQPESQMHIDGILMKPADKKKMAATIRKVLKTKKTDSRWAEVA